MTAPSEKESAITPNQSTASDDDYYDDEPDRTCKTCGGDGGDPLSDYCLPCEDCGGEGYRWWE